MKLEKPTVKGRQQLVWNLDV